ncbi:MAG TPA: sulfotransferase [Sphingomonas sp.]|jgi:hypothetical protein
MEAAFDLERSRFGKASPAVVAPIFVCGLARAGTTILMRALHASGAFASLTYRDMPFPLAPNMWAQFNAGRGSVAAQERSHGDGIVHDLDSPEAIEEVFWRCFAGDAYIRPDRLLAADPGKDALERIRPYLALVLRRYGRSRYLSKNNNNILRLSGLVRAFPDAVLLHPFRHPLEQAASLLNQHRHTVAQQRRDPFVARYMRDLAHHEFGLDHRPFAVGEAIGERNPDSLGYWLDYWVAVHRHLLDQPQAVQARQAFIDYDALGTVPGDAGASIARAAGLTEAAPVDWRAPPAWVGADAPLPQRVAEVYEQLRRRTAWEAAAWSASISSSGATRPGAPPR